MSKWFYIKDGLQRGPVTAQEIVSLIQSREISANTLVWSSGMENWMLIQDTQFKQVLHPETPPPIPSEIPPPIPPETPPPKTSESTPPITLEKSPSTDNTNDNLSQNSLTSDRAKLLMRARCRIWAHWLFWLLIPGIGSFISMAKAKIWDIEDANKDSKEIKKGIEWPGIWCFATFLMSIFGILNVFWLWLVISWIAPFLGAGLTTGEIVEAREKLKIELPMEADRMLARGDY